MHVLEVLAQAILVLAVELAREETIMGETIEKGLKTIGVTMSKPVLALIAIIFGILVIVLPELLQLIVGLYFIIQGLLFFADYFELRSK